MSMAAGRSYAEPDITTLRYWTPVLGDKPTGADTDAWCANGDAFIWTGT